ncbi:hypothetical protein SESBI_23321 [Sesbania bispinosa]|nr:hypothetical protein SESBI_23321 [Sesbania bispinosa]
MWEYGSARIDDDLSVQYLVRVIKVKWWNKFNNALVKREKIDQWLQTSKIHKTDEATTSTALTKESIFLQNKQKMMVALSTAACEEEFNKIIKSMSESSSQKDEEEVGSSPDP